MMQGRQ